MQLRSCLGCGSFTEARYCEECEPKRPKRASFRERYPADWAKRKKSVIKRDNGTCHWCGNSTDPMTADHLIPRSKGGSHELANLVCACKFCNNNRNNLSVEVWINHPTLILRREEQRSKRIK